MIHLEVSYDGSTGNGKAFAYFDSIMWDCGGTVDCPSVSTRSGINLQVLIYGDENLNQIFPDGHGSGATPFRIASTSAVSQSGNWITNLGATIQSCVSGKCVNNPSVSCTRHGVELGTTMI